MRAQDFTQSRMHQMCRGVIAPRRIALLDIDFRCDRVADFDCTFFNFDLMNDQTLHGRIGVNNLCDEGSTTCVSRWVKQNPYIANLSTAFSVERRLIENHFSFVSYTEL